MRAIIRASWTVAIGLLACQLSPSARGDFVTYTASTSPQLTTDFSVPLSVPAFDTNLGSLKDIVISYVNNSSMQGTVTNTSASSQTFTVTETVNFGLKFGDTQLLSNALIGQQTFTDLAVNATANYGVFTPSGGSPSPFVVVDGPMFDAFQGSTPITFQLGTLTTTRIAGGGGNITTGIFTTLDATLTVRYDYGTGPNVIPVPEPASLILTGLGGLFVASGWMVRRRVGARGLAGR